MLRLRMTSARRGFAVLATGVGLAAASSGFAGEMPEALRRRALEELRSLAPAKAAPEAEPAAEAEPPAKPEPAATTEPAAEASAGPAESMTPLEIEANASAERDRDAASDTTLAGPGDPAVTPNAGAATAWGLDHPISVLKILENNAVSAPPAELEPAPAVAESASPPDGAASPDGSHEPAPLPEVVPRFAATEPAGPPVAPAPPQEPRAPDVASLRRSIEARSDRSGLLGFCPVSLRDRKALTDASPDFTTEYGGETYTFASAEAKAAFEANPDYYAPARGGCDVVLAVAKVEVEGSLRHAVFYEGRLYLFRSEQTLRLFGSQPHRYVTAATP